MLKRLNVLLVEQACIQNRPTYLDVYVCIMPEETKLKWKKNTNNNTKPKRMGFTRWISYFQFFCTLVRTIYNL